MYSPSIKTLALLFSSTAVFASGCLAKKTADTNHLPAPTVSDLEIYNRFSAIPDILAKTDLFQKFYTDSNGVKRAHGISPDGAFACFASIDNLGRMAVDILPYYQKIEHAKQNSRLKESAEISDFFPEGKAWVADNDKTINPAVQIERASFLFNKSGEALNSEVVVANGGDFSTVLLESYELKQDPKILKNMSTLFNKLSGTSAYVAPTKNIKPTKESTTRPQGKRHTPRATRRP